MTISPTAGPIRPGHRDFPPTAPTTLLITGCIARDTWDRQGGYLVPVDRLADALLDPWFDRDGISILGGELFLQPEALLAVVQELRVRGCRQILVYSGYTYEHLRRMAQRQPAIAALLNDVDILVDGPYVAALSDRAGLWTGSRNQRVINLVSTRRRDHIVLVEE